MPSRSGKWVVLGEEAARRTKDVVRRVEASPQFGAPGPPGGPRLWNPGIVEAVVTTAITQGSTSTYGTGQAQIKIDNASGAPIDDPVYPGPVTVLNWSTTSGTIPVGTHIMIGWRNGGWRHVVRDC